MAKKGLDQALALVVEPTEVTQIMIADFCAGRPDTPEKVQPVVADGAYAKISPSKKINKRNSPRLL